MRKHPSGFFKSVGRGIRNMARAVEVVAGVVLISFGALAFREIVQIVRGVQPVSGATPGVVVALLTIGCVAGVCYGVHVVRKGF